MAREAIKENFRDSRYVEGKRRNIVLIYVKCMAGIQIKFGKTFILAIARRWSWANYLIIPNLNNTMRVIKVPTS